MVKSTYYYYSSEGPSSEGKSHLYLVFQGIQYRLLSAVSHVCAHKYLHNKSLKNIFMCVKHRFVYYINEQKIERFIPYLNLHSGGIHLI